MPINNNIFSGYTQYVRMIQLFANDLGVSSINVTSILCKVNQNKKNKSIKTFDRCPRLAFAHQNNGETPRFCSYFNYNRQSVHLSNESTKNLKIKPWWKWVSFSTLERKYKVFTYLKNTLRQWMQNFKPRIAWVTNSRSSNRISNASGISS